MHIPNQRARKNRRDREALKAASTAKKPKLTARVMIDAKAAPGEERYERLFKEAAAAVRKEFRRCQDKIQKIHEKHGVALHDGYEKVLYRAGRTTLTETEIVYLYDLLLLEGWNIVVNAPLNWRGKGPRPIGLLFRHVVEE